MSPSWGGIIFGPDLARRVRRGFGSEMASSLRRLIEDLAVLKPGRKATRSMSDAAKGSLGLDLSITEVLDNTLGPPAYGAGAGAAEAPNH